MHADLPHGSRSNTDHSAQIEIDSSAQMRAGWRNSFVGRAGLPSMGRVVARRLRGEGCKQQVGLWSRSNSMPPHVTNDGPVVVVKSVALGDFLSFAQKQR